MLLALSTFRWTGDGRYDVVSGALIAWSRVVWLPGLWGLWERVRAERPVLGAFGWVTTSLGAFGGISFGLQGFYEDVFGVSGQQSLDALAQHPVTAPLVLWLPGPLFPISMMFLGVTLALTRVTPRWVAAVFFLGGAAFPPSRIPRIEAVAHAADLLLLLPSATLGVVLLATGGLIGRHRTAGLLGRRRKNDGRAVPRGCGTARPVDEVSVTVEAGD